MHDQYGKSVLKKHCIVRTFKLPKLFLQSQQIMYLFVQKPQLMSQWPERLDLTPPLCNMYKSKDVFIVKGRRITQSNLYVHPPSPEWSVSNYSLLLSLLPSITLSAEAAPSYSKSPSDTVTESSCPRFSELKCNLTGPPQLCLNLSRSN